MNDRAAELDRMTDTDAIVSLEREFPGWQVYRGTEGLCHARQHEGGEHVRGEDWPDLRDQLIRWLWHGSQPGKPDRKESP